MCFLRLFAPTVFLADFCFLLRGKVVLNVEERTDLLGRLALDHGSNARASQIQQILDELCGYTTVDAKLKSSQTMTKVQSLKSLDKIPFDIEGKPMAVPRAATSKLYGGSLMGNKLMQ